MNSDAVLYWAKRYFRSHKLCLTSFRNYCYLLEKVSNGEYNIQKYNKKIEKYTTHLIEIKNKCEYDRVRLDEMIKKCK